MPRLNPPSIKVIGVGLGRTGTLSMASALESLGFQPAYHAFMRDKEKVHEDFNVWNRLANGCENSSEILDKMLEGYQCVFDYPAAICFDSLYAAYPDAKYILTIRDPVQWEKSIKEGVLVNFRIMKEANPPEGSLMHTVLRWWEEGAIRYHHGKLETHTQEEMHIHNEKVKKLIPAEQLLVYEIGEGWEKLAKFLDVSVPEKPFPHLNAREELIERTTTATRELGAQENSNVVI